MLLSSVALADVESDTAFAAEARVTRRTLVDRSDFPRATGDTTLLLLLLLLLVLLIELSVDERFEVQLCP